MKTNILIFIIFCLVCPCKKDRDTSQTKTGSLSGYISNQYGQPIENVDVKLNTATNKNIETKTSSNGWYSFTKLEIGNCQVNVMKDGFISASKKITITENKDSVCNFSLTSGETYLSISRGIIDTISSNGAIEIKVYSNTNWTVTNNSTWLSSSSNEGKGNGSFVVNWTKNLGTEMRHDSLKITAGNIACLIKINQNLPIKIISTTGIIGNDFKQIKDSAIILFDRPIKINSLSVPWDSSASGVQYNYISNNEGVKIACPYAKLGGNYTFQITSVALFLN